ncbi:MAG: TonB-dependent receptor, partial [Chitinophagales bacterium]
MTKMSAPILVAGKQLMLQTAILLLFLHQDVGMELLAQNHFTALKNKLLQPIKKEKQAKPQALKDILAAMEQEFNIHILYKSQLIENYQVNRKFQFQKQLAATFELLLPPFGLSYKRISPKTYVVTVQNSLAESTVQANSTIKGRITNHLLSPMPYVNVVLKGTGQGAATDAVGNYSISKVQPGTYVVEASSIGYVTYSRKIEIAANTTVDINAIMRQDFLALKSLVVTGVQNPISNLKSSVAVTSISPQFIEMMAPRSTADILQYIPGFYVENSAGEVGNNLHSRGISSEGSFQYVVFHEDGLPVYEAANLDWAAADNFTRLDLTIKKIEALRGGSGAVFAGNAPGGIVNFISYTGGEELAGKVKVQTTSYNQARVDVNIGGPLTDKIKFNVGGFHRTDNGIRPTGYRANEGGQLKVNLTRDFQWGYFRINSKYLDDKNVYYSSIPINNDEKPTGVKNFDPNYGTMASVNYANISMPTPLGEEDYDLTNGVRNKVAYTGTELVMYLGKDWEVRNKNRFAIIRKQGNNIVSMFAPQSAYRYASAIMRQLDMVNTFQYAYAGSDEPFDITTANDNGLVSEQGWWVNNNALSNFINSLEIRKSFYNNDITAGMYFSRFANQAERHWASFLTEVKGDKARALDLRFYDNAGNEIPHTYEGFTSFNALNTWLNSEGVARVLAIFINDEVTLSESFKIDAGIRYEHLKANGQVEDTQFFDLGYYSEAVDNAVLESVLYGNNTFTPYNYEFGDYAISIGANYNITESMAAYARVSNGYRMPDFDNWQAQQIQGGLVEDITIVEAGYKYSSDKAGFFGTFFYSRMSNQVTTDASVDAEGNLIPFRTRGSQTVGTELEALLRPVEGLDFNIVATVQDAQYKTPRTQRIDPDNYIEGNEVKRIPQVFVTFVPSYELGNFKMFGTIQHIGDRFGDETNTNVLPAYTNFNLG